MEMNINEIALLWGIQLRPILKSENFIVERSEVQDLDESLKYLTREGYVRYEEIQIGALQYALVSLRNAYYTNSKIMLDVVKDGMQLFCYIPTKKGKAVMIEYEHLKAYMKADEIPSNLTLTRFHESYKKASRQFSQDYFDMLTESMKA